MGAHGRREKYEILAGKEFDLKGNEKHAKIHF